MVPSLLLKYYPLIGFSIEKVENGDFINHIAILLSLSAVFIHLILLQEKNLQQLFPIAPTYDQHHTYILFFMQ
ncbi:MAG: hypothetical protein AB1499_18435, partial [Nitrospirota bacterium]